MTKELVAIWRSSEDPMSGRIDYIGDYQLPVEVVTILNRWESHGFNGASSYYLIEGMQDFPVVLVGNRKYRLTDNTRRSESTALWTITIRHDEEFSCPYCNRKTK